MFFENNQTTHIKVEEIAQTLGISKSLIRFWEEEFGLPKRENGSMSQLEAAEILLIFKLTQEKGLALEDAKQAFTLVRIPLEKRFETIGALQKIKQGLIELKDKMA